MGEGSGGRTRMRNKKWQVEDVLGYFSKMIAGFSYMFVAWIEKCLSGGDFLKGLRLRQKWVLPAFLQCFIAYQAFPPSTWVTGKGGQDKNAQDKWQVQDVLGTFPKCLWSFPRCLLPGEKNDETYAPGGDFLKALRLQKKGCYLHFYSVLLLSSEKLLF